MILLDNDVIKLKHEVLKHVAKLAYDDNLTDDNISKIPDIPLRKTVRNALQKAVRRHVLSELYQ